MLQKNDPAMVCCGWEVTHQEIKQVMGRPYSDPALPTTKFEMRL